MHREISFWVSVGLVSIIALALFKLLAGKVGNRVPALASLAGYL